MRLECIVFTRRGRQLAEGLLPRLAGWQAEIASGYGEDKTDLHRWTKDAFAKADALLFVGAAGIAVRAVAPLLQSKAQDPAVVVMDEGGRFAVPLLSGHIGGANRLAKQLAALCGGQAVLTTATDVNGLWAVDEWAARQGLAIVNPGQIKRVSARLLGGETVLLYSDFPLEGPLPVGVERTGDMAAAQVVLSPFAVKGTTALQLVPPCVTVGIGCRRGTPQAEIEAAFAAALEKAGVCERAVCGAASIDLKQNEQGLLGFCSAHGWQLATYTAGQLSGVKGSVSSSGFVQQVTGVDNVCERAALVGGGTLLLPKQAEGGVTVALAVKDKSYGFNEEGLKV